MDEREDACKMWPAEQAAAVDNPVQWYEEIYTDSFHGLYGANAPT